MNDQTLLELAALTLQTRDGEGRAQLVDQLHVPIAAVLAGDAALTDVQRQKLRYLFTDYEWMLAQKVAVLEETARSEQGVTWRYQNAKATIAMAWLANAKVTTAMTQVPQPNGTLAHHLRIKRTYGVHGLEDILDFVVPKPVAQQLATKKLDLLTWAAAQLPAPQPK
ncbi:hypothetical protein [Lacticaseibacillus daqingensis]|uniref:hypothetical protein n=1 Tax=Lacticaseibacillus daqingensis TaxID=2486014 RepID=UPI000F7B17B4|nr:hypothetical protein [Lacticaseibacillus daqingensis]